MSTFELTFQSGEASLSVRRIAVQEAISDLFTVSVWARSTLPDIAIDSIVGLPASLRVQAGTAYVQNLNTRLWQGICNSMELVQAEPTGLSTYHLRIVPRLWLLTQRRGQRIYQHLSIPDILDKLLAEWKIAPTWQVDRAKYPKLEYKVQHGETDYAFLSRLLEEAGIAYVLPDNGGTATTLVFTDKLQASPPRPGPPLPFVDSPNQSAEREFVTQVRLGHEVRPGASVIRDYDFRNPPFPLLGTAPPALPPEMSYEQYRYDAGAFLVESTGGGTPFADDKGIYRHDAKYGLDLSTRVLAAMRSDKRAVNFETNVLDLAPGRMFAIEGHPHPEIGAAHLMVAEFAVAGAPGQPWSMRGRALPVDPRVPYRPPLKTPKPQAQGLCSATVVGPPGAEIHTDEFGRVRVQFPWDREGKNDDNSSCWMRVSQGWAGAGYGMFMLPRVGQEVLIAFLDGDPDQPIVAGRAFNGKELVPYKLPDNMTVSTWKSSSSPGGAGYNEIKYEDKAGMELVYMQAQRDLNQLVKRDEVERTLRNKLSTVAGNEDNVVKGVRKQLVEGSDHVHVKLDQMEKVDGSVSLTVQINRDEKVGLNHALEAGAQIHIKAGMTLVLEAGLRLTIKGPGGFIDINPAGIDIVGTVVNINSGGMAGIGLGAHPTAPLDAEEALPKDIPVP
jgi:type VI secretion system secreted protein VgrG